MPTATGQTNGLLNSGKRLLKWLMHRHWKVVVGVFIMPQLTAALKLLGQSDSAAAKEWAVLYMVAAGNQLLAGAADPARPIPFGQKWRREKLRARNVSRQQAD